MKKNYINNCLRFMKLTIYYTEKRRKYFETFEFKSVRVYNKNFFNYNN